MGAMAPEMGVWPDLGHPKPAWAGRGPRPRNRDSALVRSGLPYTERMPGLLYVVATPIGNLEDITYRAVRILREADLIACEDTRQTRKLLDHYAIQKPAISYHEHNEAERTEDLVARLQAGTVIALVYDAGTPMVSDPGYRLVKASIDVVQRHRE